MAQSVERPTSAQVMISWSVGSSPTSGSVPTAQSLKPASGSVSPSLSAPPLLALAHSLSQKYINIKKKKKRHIVHFISQVAHDITVTGNSGTALGETIPNTECCDDAHNRHLLTYEAPPWSHAWEGELFGGDSYRGMAAGSTLCSAQGHVKRSSLTGGRGTDGTKLGHWSPLS